MCIRWKKKKLGFLPYGFWVPIHEANRAFPFFLSILIFKKLFIFWLCWVFVAVCRLSLGVKSGGYSSLWYVDFSLPWHLLWSAGSRWVVGFGSCGPQSLQHRLSSCDSQTLEYAGASWTGARTRIPCIGRRVLYHWPTRDTVASSVLVIFQRGGPDTPCLALTPASAHLPTVPCTFLQKAKGCTNLISWPLKRRLAAILSSDIQVTESIKMLPPNASAESGRKPIFKNLIILHHTRFVTNRKGHIPSCFTPVWKSDYKLHSMCLESRFLSISKHETARGTGVKVG